MEILGANGQAQSAGDLNSGIHAGLVKDGTDQSFLEDVIEPSKELPVLVDFWTPWCGPCRQLGPAIERAVTSADGAVRLVKINIDENPGIAGQLRIQSIPAVIAFKDGQPLDGFMGALPESQIKEFIKRISGQVSSEDVDALIERAEQALGGGDLGGAAQDFATALQMDPERPEAIAGMARIHLAGGDAAQAKAILDGAPDAKKSHPAIAAVRASMELAGEVEGAGDLADAEARAAKASSDPQATRCSPPSGRTKTGMRRRRASCCCASSTPRDRTRTSPRPAGASCPRSCSARRPALFSPLAAPSLGLIAAAQSVRP